MSFDVRQYSAQSPLEVRRQIRDGKIPYPTAGMCAGYAQANLVILSAAWADDFAEFARQNPAACPVLEVVRGTSRTRRMAADGDIARDIPRYRVYRSGVLAEEIDDASPLWRADSVGFLIGCSFSFEEALVRAGIPMRHIDQGCNVSMYKTKLQTRPVGAFRGPMVCSMRPMKPEQAKLAAEITARMPNVHGAPVHIGDPAQIGIADLSQPDYGDPVAINPGEVPVFWPCGVTPQAALENARPELAITHAPGYMFITDVPNEALNGFLQQNPPF